MEIYKGTVFGRLDNILQKAILDASYKTPTPVQEKAIPVLLAQKDLVASAQTGTGKTASFMLPVLNRLIRIRKPRRIGKPRVLVISPTRELAVQIARNTKLYLKYADIPVACLIGGVSQGGQVKDIKRGAEVMIACPGRLIDLMTQGMVFLDQVEAFVLDEADRMLDMGFLPDIKRIMSKLPLKRQTMFFSATMPPQVVKLAEQLVKEPEHIEISPESPAVEKIDQFAIKVERPEKCQSLINVLKQNPSWDKVIVFVKMRHSADRVQRKLMKAGIKGAAIHSDKTQNQRTRALDAFKNGENRVLVATDIASRGIDVQGVSCVINYDLPLELESYVHRIGRTARAGDAGIAYSLVCSEELKLLKSIEHFIKRTIPFKENLPKFAEVETIQVKKVHAEDKKREKRKKKWYNKRK